MVFSRKLLSACSSFEPRRRSGPQGSDGLEASPPDQSGVEDLLGDTLSGEDVPEEISRERLRRRTGLPSVAACGRNADPCQPEAYRRIFSRGAPACRPCVCLCNNWPGDWGSVGPYGGCGASAILGSGYLSGVSLSPCSRTLLPMSWESYVAGCRLRRLSGQWRWISRG